MRTGPRRLALGLGIPYFGFWTLFLVVSSYAYHHNLAGLRRALADDDVSLSIVYSRNVEQNLGIIFTSLLFGIVLPLLVLIVVFVVLWIRRGYALDRSASSSP